MMSRLISTFLGENARPRKFSPQGLLRRQLSKKASTTLICQIARQTRLEIFSKVAQDLAKGEGGNLFLGAGNPDSLQLTCKLIRFNDSNH